jgi:uncharacterized membrane protein YdbT with pleckstrin-like domain
MNYVDQALGEGETVGFVATKHWIVFVTPVAQIVAALILVGLGYKIEDLMRWVAFLLHWAGLILLAIGLVHLAYAWLVRATTELAVTNRKVIGKWGIISRRSIEQRVEKVDSIDVEQSILGRILGYGTVEVRGSGMSMTPIRMIAHPLIFRRRVEDAINAARP